MKEHSIIMSAESVRAILDGRKTQTRRVIVPQPKIEIAAYNKHRTFGVDWNSIFFKTVSDFVALKCPYGVRGERLWVRETWAINDVRYEHPIPNARPHDLEEIIFRADGEMNEQFEQCDGDLKWKSPIHMPRWASRLTLEVVNMRVEQVNDISEEDAMAEGCRVIEYEEPFRPESARTDFKNLWDRINSKRGYGWNLNPWVWVIEFKRVLP